MGALGAIARQYMTWLFALFFIAVIGWIYYRFSSMQSEIVSVTAQAKQLTEQRDALAFAVESVKGSITELKNARAADQLAINQASAGAEQAQQDARNVRAQFDRVIAHDEAARKFLDLPLPDAIRLHLSGSQSDHRPTDADPYAASQSDAALP